MPQLVVVHSPTPSMVRKAASRKGEGKKADAAWDSWCSGKMTVPAKPSSFRMLSRIQSFCRIQSGMAVMKERSPPGAKAR